MHSWLSEATRPWVPRANSIEIVIGLSFASRRSVTCAASTGSASNLVAFGRARDESARVCAAVAV